MAGQMDNSPVELQRFLKGAEYPCDRDVLYDQADSNGAPEEILAMVEELSDRMYESPADVMKEFPSVNDDRTDLSA